MLARDYDSAYSLLQIVVVFINSIRDSLRSDYMFSKDFLEMLRSGIKTENATHEEYEPVSGVPFEIGRFLIENKKLTNASGDFEVCKELCDHYRESNLHKLLTNLQNGINDRNVDFIGSTKEELDTVLDKLWSDAETIRKRIKVLETAMPISLALIGDLAGQAIGANQGLGFLAGLGYKAVDKIITAKNVSERLAKWGKKDYLVGIYDFKKKLPPTLS
jgi:hypothetical protein